MRLALLADLLVGIFASFSVVVVKHGILGILHTWERMKCQM